MYEKIKPIEVLIIIGIITILVTAMAAPFIQQMIHWNDGHCRNCGGNWVYKESIIRQSDYSWWYHTEYIYQCDNCGNKIETRFKK